MKDRKNALRGRSAVLGMLLLVPAFLLFAFEPAALDRGFHQRLYRELGSAQAAGVDERTLSAIGDMLLDYLSGARDNLDMTRRSMARSSRFSTNGRLPTWRT